MSPAGVVAVLYGVSELALAFFRRARGDGATAPDRGSLAVLRAVICGAIALSIAAMGWRPGRLPITLALLYRIRVEEAALDEALGPAYTAYRARTKRLISGLL